MRDLRRLEALAHRRVEDIEALLDEVSQIKAQAERHLNHVRLAISTVEDFLRKVDRATDADIEVHERIIRAHDDHFAPDQVGEPG